MALIMEGRMNLQIDVDKARYILKNIYTYAVNERFDVFKKALDRGDGEQREGV